MTAREDLTTALNGGIPKHTPRREKTPVGAIQSVTVNSIRSPRRMEWPCEHWVKRPDASDSSVERSRVGIGRRSN